MNSPSPLKARTPAFTLVETLVVTGVLAILIAIALPVVGSMTKKGLATKAISNFKQVASANVQYSADNDGQILGWGRYNNWNDDIFLMRNLNLYLSGENVSGTSAAALNKIGKGLEPFVDPLVPKENIRYTPHFPFTWAINSIFNRANGRFYQYGVDQSPWSGSLNPRRIVEFEKPASTIFAMSGGFEVSRARVADEALLNPTVPRPSPFYLYGKKDTTPVAFLDGHVEMLSFPISPDKIIPVVN